MSTDCQQRCAVIPRSVAVKESTRVHVAELDIELTRTLALVSGAGRFQSAAVREFADFIAREFSKPVP